MSGGKVDIGTDECIIPGEPIPSELLERYSIHRDPHSEKDIFEYVESQLTDEEVLHVECIKTEYVLGEPFELWDATTSERRWWVISNPTNMYSQDHFKSLDYTLSFHIGLMARVQSAERGKTSPEPTPFDEIYRRLEQANEKHNRAVEVEDYQAIGMFLREALVNFTSVLKHVLPPGDENSEVKAADFKKWCSLIADHLAAGGSNQHVRGYAKTTAEKTWGLVNWLTHSQNADEAASLLSLKAVENVVGSFVVLLQRNRKRDDDRCPHCNSQEIRTHYGSESDAEDGSYLSCRACGWDELKSV